MIKEMCFFFLSSRKNSNFFSIISINAKTLSLLGKVHETYALRLMIQCQKSQKSSVNRKLLHTEQKFVHKEGLTLSSSSGLEI